VASVGIGWLLAAAPASLRAQSAGAEPAPPRDGCVACHVGIENIHPGFELSCVDCHGGDAAAATKDAAHVLPRLPVPNDERVLPENYDLPYQRFRNPSNLRVAEQACGPCHADTVTNVKKSLHGTTAGHLGDGYYEHGLSRDRRPVFSIFPTRDVDGDVPPGALQATQQVPGFQRGGDRGLIATHFTDLPRKACMHCHLWSEGRAVDGRLGLDGDYRGQGCAACHVTYADDGRSRSRDPTIDKLEPGHPREHRFTTRIPTDTCTRCHYGDAAIGLHFRGLAQLVPGMPAGPDVPGTTGKLQNGVFYVRDDALTPEDVHHQQGMHCIDCHTAADTMGDGNIHPQMDHAVEVECTSCHGTFERVSDLTTSKGRRLSQLSRERDDVFLRSKVTGRRHRVTQVKHVLDPARPEFNAAAAAAMTREHARLECYTCHNGWNVNFFGFHFDRNEQFTQLDLISGERTPGRVTTQEKVFASFNQLRLGFNHEGMIAPWIVGFSTIGSAHGPRGEPLLRQSAPQTAAGLSGVTMVPHQMHTTRREARSCVDCHRGAAVYGVGSPNYRLAREFGYAVGAGGFHAVAWHAATPARTAAVAGVAVEGGPRALALRLDPVHGRATHAYVGTEAGDLVVVDLRNPAMPRIAGRSKALTDPRRLIASGHHLYAADGAGGVAIFDLDKPREPRLLAVLPSADARGLSLAYPWLCVADGPGGLAIADVADPAQPRFVASVDLNGEAQEGNEAFDVATLFQASRTRAAGSGRIERTRPRLLAFVAAGLDGVRVVDFTEPGQPALLHGRRVPPALRFFRGDVRGVAVNTVFDVGTAGGAVRSAEHDYLYVFAEEGRDDDRQQRLRVIDVTDAERPTLPKGAQHRVYGGPGRVLVLRAYNPPFVQHFALAAGAGGLGTLIDVSNMLRGAEVVSVWEGVDGVRDMAFEELALDRLRTEEGVPEKDVSHEGCRYLNREELLRVLRVDLGGRGGTTATGK
jgi:hypothetical protein